MKTRIIRRDSIFGHGKIFKFNENGLGTCLKLGTDKIESISIVYIPDFKEIIKEESLRKINNNRLTGSNIELFPSYENEL